MLSDLGGLLSSGGGVTIGFNKSTISADGLAQFGSDARARLDVSDNGIVELYGTNVFGSFILDDTAQYATPTGGDYSGYSARVTFSSGSNNSDTGGESFGSWVLLNSTPHQWFFRNDSEGPAQVDGVFTLEISDDGGSTTLDSIDVDVDLFVQAP